MLCKESKCVGIFIKISTGEALISIVETRVKVLTLDNFKNVLPLSLSRINTSWVVSTRVEKNERVIFCCVQIFLETIEVESLGRWVIVSVVFILITSNFSEFSMKRPGWLWN